MADRGSSLVVEAATDSSVIVAIVLGYLRVAVLPDWLFYPGLVVFLLGIGLATWAALILGRFYAPIVQVQTDQRIVDKGPYRLIRHPIYAGALMAYLGIGLALQSSAAIVLIVVLTGLGYGYRIWVEERFLKVEFGDAYVAYCACTKRIIPFIL